MLGLLQQFCVALFDMTDPQCNNRTLEATYEQFTLDLAHEASKHDPTDLLMLDSTRMECGVAIHAFVSRKQLRFCVGE